MAKTAKITGTILTASNSSHAYFCEYGEPSCPNDEANCLWVAGSWPLEEFDELVEFVREHRENLKQAEMQTED